LKLRKKNVKKAIKKACVQHVPSTVKVGSLFFVHYARDTTASLPHQAYFKERGEGKVRER
jgi:hypothetical protein